MATFETKNPATGEMVTVNVEHARQQSWTGRIGQVSGEFAYGAQDEAPWIFIDRNNWSGEIAFEEQDMYALTGDAAFAFGVEDTELRSLTQIKRLISANPSRRAIETGGADWISTPADGTIVLNDTTVIATKA